MNTTKLVLMACLCLLWSDNAFAQAVDTEPEPVAIVELGAAAARNLKDTGSSFGADVAVEVTPIENWLELEAGVIRSLHAARPSGMSICCSRSPGPYRKKRSSWWVLGRHGATQGKTE